MENYIDHLSGADSMRRAVQETMKDMSDIEKGKFMIGYIGGFNLAACMDNRNVRSNLDNQYVIGGGENAGL